MIAPGARVVVVPKSSFSKAAYLRENVEAGDLVWDFDLVAAVLWGRGFSVGGLELPPHEIAGTMVAFWAIARWITNGLPADRRAVLVVFDRDRAQIVAAQLGAEYVELES